MDGLLRVAALVSLVVTVIEASGSSWTYGETNGPAEWQTSYPKCGLTRQSPINLPDPQEMDFDSSLKPFKLSGFLNPQEYKLKILNNGHTVQVNVEKGDLTVEGGGLPGRYKTAQFHFHWGRDDSQGSEHRLQDRSFPMELHVVNYNEKYGNLSNAVSRERDGLAVLGFFFVVSDKGDNSGLTTLLSKFNDIKSKGSMAELSGFSIDSMLPFASGNGDRFYRYSGSLTTPPCYESVVWTLFENTIPISAQQMAMFRKLQEDASPNSDHLIVDNFRPLQALGRRQVAKSFDMNSASGQQLSLLTLFLVILCYI